jgi:phosphatidylglycerophosphate synthase
VADDLHGSSSGHKESILEDSTIRRDRRTGLLAQAPNALTLSRFVLAAAWIALSISMPDARATFAALAIVAAVTDFIDGRIARRLGVAHERGGWLDSIADVTFVLAALGCYAAAGQLPWSIPILIAISFAQYAADSMWLHRAGAPVRSRLGHWGGIINYALVLAFSLTKPDSLLRTHLTGVIPVVELFYIAAIIERALTYQRVRRR